MTLQEKAPSHSRKGAKTLSSESKKSSSEAKENVPLNEESASATDKKKKNVKNSKENETKRSGKNPRFNKDVSEGEKKFDSKKTLKKEFQKKGENNRRTKEDTEQVASQGSAAPSKVSWSNIVKKEVPAEKKETIPSTESATTSNNVKQNNFIAAVGSPRSAPVEPVKNEEAKVLPKPIARKFKIEEPVTVPGESNIVDIGLRFGSLHLDESVSMTSSQAAKSAASNVSVSSVSASTTNISSFVEEKEKFSNPRYTSSGMQASASPLVGKQPEYQTPSYIPGIGMPGFDYSNEMQARAYAMGYFNDPNYAPSDSSFASTPRSDNKNTSTPAETMGNQQGFPPMGPMHYFYPPFFVPGQYPSYQASYGHGMVNKGVYPPQMYPQNAQQKPMTHSPYPPYINPMYMGQPGPISPAPGFTSADKASPQEFPTAFNNPVQNSLYSFHPSAPQSAPKSDRLASSSEYHSGYQSKPAYDSYNKYPNNSSYFNPITGVTQQQSFGYAPHPGNSGLSANQAPSTPGSVSQNSSNAPYGRHQYWNSQH